MRTSLLAAAIAAALVLPVVAWREPPVPLATELDAQPQDLDPVLEMVANGCRPSIRSIDDGLALIQLCPDER